MTPNRERVWVGLFVVVAIAVLSVTTVAVWGGMGRSGVPHRTYFKYSGGVQTGTAVRYGGLRVGVVRRVQVDPGDSTRIEIDFVVDPGTPLKTDSVAKLASLGPLSDSYVEISPGANGGIPAEPGAVIDSVESVGLAQLGDVVQTLVPQIRDVMDRLAVDLDSLQITVARANDLLNDGNRANIGQALTRANDMLSDRNRTNLSASLDNLNQLLSDSRPKVSAALTSANDAAGRLAPLLDDMKAASERAHQMLANLDSILAENRQDLRGSVSELREVLAQSTAAVNQLQDLMNQNAGNIYEILENMRSSAVNIRSLTETVKSNPSTLIRGVNVEDRRPGVIEK